MDRPRVYLQVGLPRSGKTRHAKSLQEKGFVVVNPDSIRVALHGQRYAANAEPYVWAIAKTMVRALIAAGHLNIVIDATHNTEKRRKEWLSEEWDTYYHYFNTPKAECIRRALAIKDEEIIPVIERMAAEHEPLTAFEKRFCLNPIW